MIRSAYSSFILLRDSRSGGDVRSYKLSSLMPFIFLTSTILLSLLAVPGNGSGTRLRCFVCLPDDKDSLNAKAIIALFPEQSLPDCSDLSPLSETESEHAQKFQFDCPRDYHACSLRSQGFQISRSCTPKTHTQKCFLVNSVQICYCAHSLCNRNNGTVNAMPPMIFEPVRTSRRFTEGETDDEDLLTELSRAKPGHSHQSHQIHEFQEEGSGSVEQDEVDEEIEEKAEIETRQNPEPIEPPIFRNVPSSEEQGETNPNRNESQFSGEREDRGEQLADEEKVKPTLLNGDTRIQRLSNVLLFLALGVYLVSRRVS